IHKKQKERKQNKKKQRRQDVAVCVALRVSARHDRKETKQEGKKCALRPTGPRRTPTRHGSLSAPFVAAPPHACSRRGAQGRRHERVGGCASGAVGRETHGTPHRKSAEETIKEGRVEKKKEVHSGCPKSRKEGKKKKAKKKELRRVIHYRMCVGVGEGASVPHWGRTLLTQSQSPTVPTAGAAAAAATSRTRNGHQHLPHHHPFL
ncbi:hypothetical protein TCSYLVIO_000692, partial [Trypanosoma cruzi]